MPSVSSESFLPNTVMYTITTAGFVPFVLNLHASMKRIGISNHLVVYTPDQEMQRELSSMGLRSICFGQQDLPVWADFLTAERGPIVAYKYAVATEILLSGRNALFVDGDIVFLRNPARHLKMVIDQSSAQMIMQYESPGNVYNTGFWFARPHPAVLNLFQDIQDKLLVYKMFTSDQQCFNEITRDSDRIVLQALDVELFACGNQFLGKLADPTQSIDRSANPFPFKSAYLLHFNYLIGKEVKVNAMKEFNAIFYPELLTAPDAKRSLWSRFRRKVRGVG
jgi:Nucleotide-diphospho-sugar transferase